MSIQEERVPIKGYEEIYDITISGRIIVKRSNKARHRNGDEYGYVNVHLSKDGERSLLKTFELWKTAFPNLSESEFKGMK